MRTVEIPISKIQEIFLSSEKRIALFLAGRGSGKTKALSIYALMASAKGKKGRGLVGANNPDQVQQIVVPALMQTFNEAGVEFVWGASPPWYESYFPHHYNILSVSTGYQIACRSMFEYDKAVRGIDCTDIMLDEIRDMESKAIDVAAACLRGFGETDYKIRACTTPNGKDHVWKKFIKNQKPDTEVITCGSSENPWLPASFVQGLKDQYSDDLYRQEVLGEILDMNIGRVYLFTEQNVSENIPDEQPTSIVFSLDFNVQPMGGVLLYWYEKTKSFYQFDEVFVRSDATTKAGCDQAKEKVKKCKYPNIPFWFMGDEAGSARSTKGVSDIQLMKNCLNGRCLNDGSKPRIIDRINSCNCLLSPMSGTARLIMHPKCEQTILDMETMRWQEDKRETEKNDIERSHWSEALGYAVYRLCPVKGKNISGYYQGD